MLGNKSVIREIFHGLANSVPQRSDMRMCSITSGLGNSAKAPPGAGVHCRHACNSWPPVKSRNSGTATALFLRMGVDELSMNAKSILPVRKIIRSVDLSKPSEK